jgi:serine/threonine protein kinase
VDVWGVGLVLYQAATGLQPFDLPDRSASTSSYTSTMARCQALLSRPAPKIRARRRLPTGVAETIDACLRREPAQRPTLERLDAALVSLISAG